MPAPEHGQNYIIMMVMNDIKLELLYLFDESPIYHTSNGVELVAWEDDAINIAVSWPGHTLDPEFIVELYIATMSLDEFIAHFKIQSIQDLDKIDPEMIKDEYENGRAQIYCIIERAPNFYFMYFRKVNDRIMAKDNREKEHVVKSVLKKTDDFKRYIERYYKLEHL